jgi:transcriptional regulator with PAS, ATPase and Fis domain
MLISLVRRYDQIPWLRELRAIICRWWRVDVLYLDKEGAPVYLPGRPDDLANRLCAVCHGQAGGRARCCESMRRASVAARELGAGATATTLGYHCHLGLTSMIAPIMIPEGDGAVRDGGSLYSSGFLARALDPLEEQQLLASGAAIDPALAERAVLATVPVLGGEELSYLGDVIRLGVASIVTLFAELHAKEQEIDSLRRRLDERRGLGGLVGGCAAMQEVYRLIERVAANDCTVLVRGESGTGKELVANAIHGLSARAAGPFVVQNCSAFNDNLLESELFGHLRGSFTGAVSDKRGLFEAAHGGTLFLDEVAEMSPALQAKLLRVLQDGSFLPVGATSPRHSDARIVAATHRPLEEMVAAGSFREDLYYRLNVISIPLPPLRERKSDIPALAEHLLGRRGDARLSGEALRVLCGYDWPGNVRELANELERMTVLAGADAELLGRELISPRVLERALVGSGEQAAAERGSLREALESLEARMIRGALERCSGNRSHAAKLLGIARSNLLVKIKAYRIEA